MTVNTPKTNDCEDDWGNSEPEPMRAEECTAVRLAADVVRFGTAGGREGACDLACSRMGGSVPVPEISNAGPSPAFTCVAA